ncbi:uncharacterized protein LOC130613669 isoform X2 [Hydractinia symbiolongicarpus]|uniref:uncharacterized protein LOC130613669 isoform X2 n=1 Tax=Hydractinia symbiolongicarpus TaxID=13093 RepID=UPI0025505B9A|nr:uncharacterized protein LOC130613669 isoform X2 [Hydractinia symbiolongicarpus]
MPNLRTRVEKAIGTRRQDVSRSANLRCVEYNHVLPSGGCIEFFNNTYVAGTREEIITKEDLFVGLFREGLPVYDFFFKQGRQNDITRYGKCGRTAKARKVIQSTYFPSTKELLECGQKKVFRELTCRHWIPVCVTHNETHRRKRSPMCRETCEKLVKNTPCEKVLNFFAEIRKLFSICPDFISTLAVSKHILDIESCEDLRWKNTSVIESCQAVTSNDVSVKKYSTYCYHGNGLFYNGNEDIPVTSKKCLPWNINPYLNKELYPTLKENHCRNPQGFRLKPWCYTDTVGFAWEYCNVKKCKTTTARHSFMQRYKWYLVIFLALLVLGLSAVLVVRRRIRFRNEEETPLEPYASCEALNSEHIRKAKLFALPSRLLNETNYSATDTTHP